jgi:YesN/AraC family two-component response regulator
MQRVLIVDDEQIVADTLTMVFEKSGFHAKAAYSTNDALDQAREFVPDLLLCDISMPGKDGLFLVNEINRELPDCRILVLTGFYSNHSAVHETATRLSRRVPILTKPVHPEDLLREASAALAHA